MVSSNFSKKAIFPSAFLAPSWLAHLSGTSITADNGRVSNGVSVAPQYSNEWAWPDGHPYISQGPHGMGMDVTWLHQLIDVDQQGLSLKDKT